VTTLSFPIDTDGTGAWKLETGDQAIEQIILAATKTLPGELPLSRNYGLWIDYNLPLELAEAQASRIYEIFEEWYPELEIVSLQFIPAGDGTLAKIDIQVKEV